MSRSPISLVQSQQASPSSSRNTLKASWSPTRSLERMLRGRSLPGISPDILKNLPVLPAVTFPTFEQLTSKTQEPTQPSTDLFSALVRDPRELLQDYIERPEAYRHEVLPIVLELVGRTKNLQDLTEEERILLSSATTTFAERSKPSSTSTATSHASPESKTPDPMELAWGDENADDESEQELEYGAPAATDVVLDALSEPQVDPTKLEAPKEISLEDFVLEPGWWKNQP